MTARTIAAKLTALLQKKLPDEAILSKLKISGLEAPLTSVIIGVEMVPRGCRSIVCKFAAQQIEPVFERVFQGVLPGYVMKAAMAPEVLEEKTANCSSGIIPATTIMVYRSATRNDAKHCTAHGNLCSRCPWLKFPLKASLEVKEALARRQVLPLLADLLRREPVVACVPTYEPGEAIQLREANFVASENNIGFESIAEGDVFTPTKCPLLSKLAQAVRLAVLNTIGADRCRFVDRVSVVEGEPARIFVLIRVMGSGTPRYPFYRPPGARTRKQTSSLTSIFSTEHLKKSDESSSVMSFFDDEEGPVLELEAAASVTAAVRAMKNYEKCDVHVAFQAVDFPSGNNITTTSSSSSSSVLWSYTVSPRVNLKELVVPRSMLYVVAVSENDEHHLKLAVPLLPSFLLNDSPTRRHEASWSTVPAWKFTKATQLSVSAVLSQAAITFRKTVLFEYPCGVHAHVTVASASLGARCSVGIDEKSEVVAKANGFHNHRPPDQDSSSSSLDAESGTTSNRSKMVFVAAADLPNRYSEFARSNFCDDQEPDDDDDDDLRSRAGDGDEEAGEQARLRRHHLGGQQKRQMNANVLVLHASRAGFTLSRLHPMLDGLRPCRVVITAHDVKDAVAALEKLAEWVPTVEPSSAGDSGGDSAGSAFSALMSASSGGWESGRMNVIDIDPTSADLEVIMCLTWR